MSNFNDAVSVKDLLADFEELSDTQRSAVVVFAMKNGENKLAYKTAWAADDTALYLYESAQPLPEFLQMKK